MECKPFTQTVPDSREKRGDEVSSAGFRLNTNPKLTTIMNFFTNHSSATVGAPKASVSPGFLRSFTHHLAGFGLALMLLLGLAAQAQNDYQELQKLVAADRGASDFFGQSVSISGDRAIVGAYLEDEDTAGGNTSVAAGSAYIFERDAGGAWQQVQKLVASDRGANDRFGYSVSISAGRAIVGAYREEEDTAGGNSLSDAGSAYIFERDAGGTWQEVQKLTASDRGALDNFGWSVSISDGRAIVGAYQEDQDTAGGNFFSRAGSAYLFERDGSGTWQEVQKLVASDRGANDRFGYSVSISGERAIVGAIEEDEDTAGGNALNNAGSAYLFERDGAGIWQQVQKLTASDRGVDDNFGFSVSISGDRAIAGAYQEDQDTAGGNTLSDAGSAYLYERDGGGVWQQVQKLIASDRGAGDLFGWSVSISGDRAIVGAVGEDEDTAGGNFLFAAGSAYIFERDGGGAWQEAQKLAASDRGAFDQFGISVSISGHRAIVGAIGEDEDTAGGNTLSFAGSAYIFEMAALSCTAPVAQCQDTTVYLNANGIAFIDSTFLNNGSAAACGLDSFAVSQATFTCADVGANSVSLFIYDINGDGDTCVATVTVVDTFNTPILRDTSICNGDSILLAGAFQRASGVFTDSLSRQSGCDSIVITALTVRPASFTALTDSICSGDSILLGGVYQTASGVFNDTLMGANGCDSVVQTTLIVNPTFNDTLTPMEICDGDSVMIFGNFENTAGTFTDSSTSAAGCDSVTTMELIVNPTFNDTTAAVQICQGDSAMIFGNFETMAGFFTDSATSANGCDSVTTTELQTVPNITTEDTLTICEGDTAVIFGMPQTREGMFTDTSVSSGGCDSIATVCLIINQIDSTMLAATTCDPAMAGTSSMIFTGSDGCDSVVTTMTALLASFNDTTAPVIVCDGDSALIFGNFENMAGTFTDSSTSAAGCDSITITELIVNPIFNNTTAPVQICQGDSVMIFGTFRSMAGTFTDSAQTAAGCDSITITELQVVPMISTKDTLTICDGDTAIIFGMPQTMAGTFTDTSVSGGGCDSIATVCLIVNQTDSTMLMATTCDPAVAGSSTMTFMGTDGCDSVVTTVTTLLPGSNDTTAPVVICEGDSAVVFGNFETMAGFFTDSATNGAGCDSITTTELIVNDTNITMVADSICPGDSVFIAGAFRDTAGNFSEILTNASGCDSTVVTELALRNDSGCTQQPTGPCGTVVISDTSFRRSTTVRPSNLSGNWNGVNGNLPPVSSFTVPVDTGQPYSFPSIDRVDSAHVITSGNNIRFYRKSFNLQNNVDVEARFRLSVDDQAEIYVNGKLVTADYSFGQSTYKSPPLDVMFNADGTVDNPNMGNEPFDFATGGDLDTIFRTGANTVTVVVRNLAKATDRGGFSFRMDVGCTGTGDTAAPPLPRRDSCVSDTSWRKSTVITPSSFSGTWSGTNGLPPDSTFTLPVDTGQPYSFHSIDRVAGSHVIKSANNIRYFRKTFDLTESDDLDARFRATFDDQVEIYVNGIKLLRENTVGANNDQLPAHDIAFDGTAKTFVNGNAGGEMYDFVGTNDLDSVFQTGTNTLTVALRNFSKASDRGGFSFRLDVSKGGQSVLVKKDNATARIPLDEEALVEVFPNPTTGKLTLLLPVLVDGETAQVVLTDFAGKTVERLPRSAGNPPIINIDLGSHASGLYFVRYVQGRQVTTVKVVKK